MAAIAELCLGAVPLLELRDFGLGYHDRTVLRSVSFDVPPAGCTVLLGPSGTGKSSLLRTLAGFNDNNPSLQRWGRVTYQQRPLSQENRPSMVMQKSQLMVANVLDNLQAGLPDRSRLTRLEQIDRITQAVLSLEEPWVIDQFLVPVIHLTLAQQRIVAILRETLSRPALLMLDEPTSGMSSQDAAPLLALIGRISRAQAVLAAMHHLEQTQMLAQNVVLLASGCVQEATTAGSFFSAPVSEAGQQFLRSGSCPEYPLDDPSRTTIQPGSVAEEDNPVAPVAPNALGLTKASGSSSPSALAGKVEAAQYPSAPSCLARSAACGPRGFVWLLPGQLAGTPWPGILREQDEDLDDLQHVGVTRLVNLTEEPFDAIAALHFGIACHQLPMRDMDVPTATDAARLCTEIDAWIASGDVIALHCRAGLGRTGTLLAVYWLWLGNGHRSAIESVEQIRRLNANMIQSQAQVDFLSTFAERLEQYQHS